jgi:hypothetical protein
LLNFQIVAAGFQPGAANAGSADGARAHLVALNGESLLLAESSIDVCDPTSSQYRE